jgi:hypothetical protein
MAEIRTAFSALETNQQLKVMQQLSSAEQLPVSRDAESYRVLLEALTDAYIDMDMGDNEDEDEDEDNAGINSDGNNGGGTEGGHGFSTVSGVLKGLAMEAYLPRFEREEMSLQGLISLAVADIQGMGIPSAPSQLMFAAFQALSTESGNKKLATSLRSTHRVKIVEGMAALLDPTPVKPSRVLYADEEGEAASKYANGEDKVLVNHKFENMLSGSTMEAQGESKDDGEDEGKDDREEQKPPAIFSQTIDALQKFVGGQDAAAEVGDCRRLLSVVAIVVG